MIIKSFKGKNIHKFLNFNIKFNKKLNFLIGINGSGKTTILELIESLLKPNFRTFNRIFFDEISVTLETKYNKNLNIRAKRKNDNVVISMSDIENKKLSLFIPISDDYMDEPRMRRNSIYSEINNLNEPIYLKASRSERKDQREVEKIFLRSRKDRDERYHRRYLNVRGGIEALARQYIMTLSYIQEELSNELQSKIISLSLQYSSSDKYRFRTNLSEYLNFEKQSKKREILIEVINELNLKKSLLNQIDKFFSEMNKLANALKGEKDIFNPKSEFTEEKFELLSNGSQIRRIEELLDLIADYKQSVDKIYEPLRNYREAINLFFNDTNKEVNVSKDGGLEVLIKGKGSVPIDRLSSGEKQVLLILSHLAFNQRMKEAGVFIIDEPELSLHLAWQEVFVESILKVNQELQLILATHSPSILSNHKKGELVISIDEQLQK